MNRRSKLKRGLTFSVSGALLVMGGVGVGLGGSGCQEPRTNTARIVEPVPTNQGPQKDPEPATNGEETPGDDTKDDNNATNSKRRTNSGPMKKKDAPNPKDPKP